MKSKKKGIITKTKVTFTIDEIVDEQLNKYREEEFLNKSRLVNSLLINWIKIKEKENESKR